MADPVDSHASVDDPSPGSAVMPAASARRSIFRDLPWRWTDLLIVFAPPLLLSTAAYLLGRPPLAAYLHRTLLPTLLSDVWILVVPLWIAHTRTTRPARLPRPRTVLVEALVALLVLPVVCVGMIAVSEIAAKLLGELGTRTVPWGARAETFGRTDWLAFIALAVTLGPVAEETFYRGMLYNLLRQRLHPILAALIQAALFGYAHPFGLANSITIGGIALVLAFVYEWRKTLLTPILLHAAVNSVGMVFVAASVAAAAAAPRLGVWGEAHQGGCLVTDVMSASAADSAGLKAGDVITSVDGQPVADIPDIVRIVRTHRVGDTVSVEYVRGGEAHRADVALAPFRK
jgi:membrane protease YdiL (CAAX protease family)